MIEIAIVEDDDKDAQILSSYIERHGSEKNILFRITRFPSADALLFDYRKRFDIIFMDIRMPGQDGMASARKLREIDDVTILIFCTTISQLAHRGYEVDAMDYLIKPVEYLSFSQKLDRAVRKLNLQSKGSVSIKTAEGLAVLQIREIRYVEIQNHVLLYHTEKGIFSTYQSLKAAMLQLPETLFFKCNNCYLINLSYVTKISGFELFLGSERLQISHPRRSAFMEALQKYLMGEKKR